MLEIGGYLNLHDSYISADGENGSAGTTGRVGGGGSGGTINILANTLVADSEAHISADGGNGVSQAYSRSNYSGAGGGGRIELSSGSSFPGEITVNGGSGNISACNGTEGTSNLILLNSSPDSATLMSANNYYANKTTDIIVKYSDSDGKDDLDKLYLDLHVEGGDEDIEYYATETASNAIGVTPTEEEGSEYIESITYDIYPISSGSYTVNINEIIVVWHVTPNWRWMDDSDIEVGVRSIDDSSADSGYSYTDSDYQYENDLTFTGTLLVEDSNSNEIESGDWVAPEEDLTWSGLKVVYEGTTDVYPNNTDFNVRVQDDDSNIWLDGSSSGRNISLSTTSQILSTSEDIHNIDIINIPTGGDDLSAQTFTLRVDAEDPQIESFISTTHTESESWYSDNTPSFSNTYADNESGINTVYAYITENSTETDEDVIANGNEITEESWTYTTELENGIWYTHFVVGDNVGNTASDSIEFRIDTVIPDIVDITGDYENEWQNEDSGPVITWTDPQSLSDDRFYITTNGSNPSSESFRYGTNQNRYNLPDFGDGEHIVKVIAKSGSGVYSDIRSFVIKYDNSPTGKITDLTTTVSATNNVTLSWSNPTDDDFDKVMLYRGDSLIYEGSAETYTDSNLNSSTRYTYNIFAYDSLGNESDSTTVNVTTRDLIPPATVDDFGIEEIGSSVMVVWSNPLDSDFEKIILSRDGKVIYEGNEESYTLEDDLNEGVYEYEIYAVDSNGNKSGTEVIEHEFVFVEEEEEIIENNTPKETVITVVSEDDKEQTSDNDIVVKESEDLEIKIPVDHLIGENVVEDIDKVVLIVNDKEYEMTLSQDKKHFTTKVTAPSVKGEHTLTAQALNSTGSILSEISMNISVADDYSNEQSPVLWIVIGASIFIILVLGVLFTEKRRAKN